MIVWAAGLVCTTTMATIIGASGAQQARSMSTTALPGMRARVDLAPTLCNMRQPTPNFALPLEWAMLSTERGQATSHVRWARLETSHRHSFFAKLVPLATLARKKAEIAVTFAAWERTAPAVDLPGARYVDWA